MLLLQARFVAQVERLSTHCVAAARGVQRAAAAAQPPLAPAALATLKQRLKQMSTALQLDSNPNPNPNPNPDHNSEF